jgi:hypothetical protein
MMATLIQLMKCPVDWEKQTGHQGWDESLMELDWFYCLAQHAVDRYELPREPWDWERLESNQRALEMLVKSLREKHPQSLRGLRAELSMHERSLELYKDRAGRLSSLNFTTPSERATKHFVVGAEQNRVISATEKKTRSLFFSDYTSDQFRRAFWTWFRNYFEFAVAPGDYDEFVTGKKVCERERGKLWRRFLEESHLRIAMSTAGDIGASRGKATSFICYDILFDNKHVHCYPVSEAQAKEIMGTATILNVGEL